MKETFIFFEINVVTPQGFPCGVIETARSRWLFRRENWAVWRSYRSEGYHVVIASPLKLTAAYTLHVARALRAKQIKIVNVNLNE